LRNELINNFNFSSDIEVYQYFGSSGVNVLTVKFNNIRGPAPIFTYDLSGLVYDAGT